MIKSRLFSFLILVPLILALLEDQGKKGTPRDVSSPASSSSPEASPEASPASPSPESSPSGSPESPRTDPSPSPTAAPEASPVPTPAPSASPGSSKKRRGRAGMAHLEAHVFDAGTKEPINRSEVLIPEINLETFTDPEGTCHIRRIPMREKPYEIMIIHPGYEHLYDKKTFDKDEKYKLEFFLKKKGF